MLRVKGVRGPAIVLNAVPEPSRNHLEFDLRPSHGARRDIDIARRLGATYRRSGDVQIVQFDAPAARAFMLYHVLLHEIGHLSDPDWVHGREEAAERFAWSASAGCGTGA